MRRFCGSRVAHTLMPIAAIGGVLLWGCGKPGPTPSAGGGRGATAAPTARAPKNADTVGLYGSANAVFMLTSREHPNTIEKTFSFGAKKAGMLAIAGDWNGDKVDEVGVYDTQEGKFSLLDPSSDKGAAKLAFGKRKAGWLPIAGDWDGDGKDSVGLYDQAEGVLRLTNAIRGEASVLKSRCGPRRSKWIPIAGDWNGDGKDSVGLYDPAKKVFRLFNEGKAGGKSDLKFSVYPGQAGTLPVAGDWNGDGRDSVGWYDPASGSFYLKNDNKGGAPEMTIRLGVKGGKLQPVAGRW